MLNLFRSLLNKRGEGRGSPFSPLLRHRNAPALRLQWFWNLWRRKVVSSDKSVQAITSNPAEFHSQCQNVECCEIYGSFVRLNHFPFLLNLTNIQHISVASIQELTASGQKSSVYNCVYSSAFCCISSDQIHRMPVENHCIRICFCTKISGTDIIWAEVLCASEYITLIYVAALVCNGSNHIHIHQTSSHSQPADRKYNLQYLLVTKIPDYSGTDSIWAEVLCVYVAGLVCIPYYARSIEEGGAL